MYIYIYKALHMYNFSKSNSNGLYTILSRVNNGEESV